MTPYTLEELRGLKQPDMARVRATVLALKMAEERLAHPAAAMGADSVLQALQRQREACARMAREYPASVTLGDQLGKYVRATPLVEVKP